jgi:uncharacterized protein (DUF2147 family)
MKLGFTGPAAARRLSALLAMAIVAIPHDSAGAADRSFGVWRNPSNSVHVRTDPCAERMCGTVVWANDKATADARRGGTDKLIGSQLFRGFVLEKPGVWRGKVFVPDIAKIFSGTVSVVDGNTLKGSGCLVGRFGCKSQLWTRIAD